MSNGNGSRCPHQAQEAAGPIEAALRRNAEQVLQDQQPLHFVVLSNNDGDHSDDDSNPRFIENDEHVSGAASPTKFEDAAAVRFLSQPTPATASSAIMMRMAEASDAAGFTDISDDDDEQHHPQQGRHRRSTHTGLLANAHFVGPAEAEGHADSSDSSRLITIGGRRRVRHRALSQPCYACLDKQRRVSAAASFAMATTAPSLKEEEDEDEEGERIDEESGELPPKRRKPLPTLPSLPKGAKCMPPLERFQASPCMAVAKRARSVAPAASPLSPTTTNGTRLGSGSRTTTATATLQEQQHGASPGSVQVCRHCRATKPEALVAQLMKLGVCEHTSPKTTHLRHAPDNVKLHQREEKRPISRVPLNYTPRVVSQPHFSPGPRALLP